MGRIYKAKTDRERKTEAEVMQAIKEVLDNGKSVRAVAKNFGFSKSALARYIKDYKATPKDQIFKHKPNTTIRKVFPEDKESQLSNYLLTASKMHHGLTKSQCQRLAFEYADALKLTFPESWSAKKQAGKDWFYGFMSRHPNLSLRSPEATSLSRSTSFNKHNVDEFFNNLKFILDKENLRLTPENIWNLDETGVSTVHKPPKVVASKGQKQVGQSTSAERGVTVTMCCFINAIGNTVPPVYIFPRVRFKDFMLNGAPTGSLGLAHTSGWMTTTNFVPALKHFISHVKCTKESKVLLLLDNHDSHISVEAIELARDTGVIMLTFPPHCSHRLQPLDVSVYGPFKMRYNAACNDWMLSNPGQTITIYNVAALSTAAYKASFTPGNIGSGFSKTGIFPFNSNIFTDDDFLMSAVTDRPSESSEPGPSGAQSIGLSENPASSISTNPELVHSFSPENIRPFPKAGPRLTSGRGRRRKGKTRILTDTPEKLAIEQQKSNSSSRGKQSKRNVRKKLRVESSSSSSSEEESSPSAHTDSDESTGLDNYDLDPFDFSSLKDGDFALVKFETKSTVVHYVAKIQSVNLTELDVIFMRKKGSKFYFPDVEDSSVVEKNDVVIKLPAPDLHGGTERTKSLLSFGVDLEKFNIR